MAIRVAKADAPSDEDINYLLDTLDTIDWKFLVNPSKKQLNLIGQPLAISALSDLGADDEDTLWQASQKVLDYASQRAAEMVGMRQVDGILVPNPDAKWAISETTRDMLRSTVRDALTNGTSGGSLKVLIQESPAFHPSRAKMIAQTEMKNAYIGGSRAGWEASGLPLEKRSLLSADHEEPDICDDCADDGWIAYDEDFAGGDFPSFHPRCHCSVIVRVKK